VHFINPVIGKRLSKEEIQNQYNADLTKQFINRELLPNEIGCALSHRKAWNLILNSDKDYGLILEDDALISGNFNRYYKELLSFLDNMKAPFVLLLTPNEYYARKSYFRHEYIEIYRFYNGYYTTGYIINKQAITILLSKFPKVAFPADLWNEIKKHVPIYSAVPYPVSISISETIFSTINNNSDTGENLKNFDHTDQKPSKVISIEIKSTFLKIFKKLIRIKAQKLLF